MTLKRSLLAAAFAGAVASALPHSALAVSAERPAKTFTVCDSLEQTYWGCFSGQSGRAAGLDLLSGRVVLGVMKNPRLTPGQEGWRTSFEGSTPRTKIAPGVRLGFTF